MTSEIQARSNVQTYEGGFVSSPEQVQLVKDIYCKDSTDNELKLFLYQCKRTGLDPLARQIYAMKRSVGYGENRREELSIQVGIDGYRLMAERSGKYEGQTPVQWCDKEGKWSDVWISKDFPHAAKIGIYKTGFKEPLVAIAYWDEYVATTRDGRINSMWMKRGASQLAKCAEALGLRKAFPQELSGIYTSEEMNQADNVTEAAKPAVKKGKYIKENVLKEAAEYEIVPEIHIDLEDALKMIEDSSSEEELNAALDSLRNSNLRKDPSAAPKIATAKEKWLAEHEVNIL